MHQRIYQYLQTLVDTTSDAMIALNQDLQILAVNPAMTTTFGWSSGDAVGRRCTEVLKCRNLNHTELCGTSSCPLVIVLERKKQLSNEELIIGAEPGHSCEVSVNVTPVDIGDGPCVIFTTRDVSTLKVANRVRANFLSMVSHELRTPLNSAHGFIELLVQGHMGELTEEQHLYLSYAQEGIQQLISIVEDILFMTRSDLGQFVVKQQKVNLRTLTKQIMSSLQPQALKAEVAIRVDTLSPMLGAFVHVDPQRIKQVLNNLMTNAIKFTPPGGTVTIRVWPYNESFVKILVSDTGYGIPPEDRQHVFVRFYQSNHSLQSKMGGYGLGLSIAKSIVEQHGGIIWLESESDTDDVNRG